MFQVQCLQITWYCLWCYIYYIMWNFTDSKRFIQKCHTVQNINIDVCDSIEKPKDATINTQTNWIIFFLCEFWQYCECTKNYNINLHVLYLQPPKHSYKPTEIHGKPLEAVNGQVNNPTLTLCSVWQNQYVHNDPKQQ